MADPRFSRYANKVALRPGEVLKYIPGQGYVPVPGPSRIAAAAAAAPTSQGWQDTLNNEGIYRAQNAGLTAEGISDTAKRDAAVKAMQFQYNDPSNPYSTVGEMMRNRDRSQADMIASRAARGVMASGGTRVASQDIGHDFGLANYNALNSLTSGIGTLDQQLADANRGRFGQQQQFLSDAQKRLIDAGIAPVGPGGVRPGGASTVLPGTSATGVVAGGGGMGLDSFGHPVTAPSAQSGQAFLESERAAHLGESPAAYAARKAFYDTQNYNLGVKANRANATLPNGQRAFQDWQYNTPGYMGDSGHAPPNPFKQKLKPLPQRVGF